MCAFYLEEFSPKNRFTDLLEISINNLAAVPSIIYGLLGLVLYLQFFNLPRSSSLVGGLTLFMLVLPIIIITTRNAIRTIPKSIRDGALALGASKMQIALHHLLPLSIPGIMTGTILAISRALGETAPLLMIGMVAFIADVPQTLFDASSALPVQIFLWSDLPENGFVEKTSAAILVLLALLITLNLTAVILRKKFE
jgi:phosphate transport system permease protein